MTTTDPTAKPSSNPLRPGSAVVDFLLLATLIALPLAWFFDPLRITFGPLNTTLSWNWKPVVIPLIVFIARQVLIGKHILRPGFLSHTISKKLLTSWLMTWGILIGFDSALALVGVKPELTAPIVIRGQEDSDTHLKEGDAKVIIDPELLFRFAPHVVWDGIPINALGFRDNDFPAEKPAGTRRVINMGDSCTAQGHPPYSTVLNELLQKSAPTAEPWHSFNTGVYGYSSMQGLRLFENHVKNFQPDVVTLYYGWNDHWLYGVPDSLRMARRLSPMKAAIVKGIQDKRIYTALSRASKRLDLQGKVNTDQKVFRVPPADYKATLTQFVKDIRAVGAVPLLITAPGRSLSEALVKRGFATRVEDAEAAHVVYLNITREVAAETKTPLLDLAAIMADSKYDALFSGDGIHFIQDGTDFIAQQLHSKLLELGAEGVLTKK